MALINQKWHKILELFFEFPSEKFTVREIARKTKIPSSTVQRHIKKLKEKGIITKENNANITPYFKFLKTFFIIDKLYETGLIDYLKEKLNPGVIVIFGSVRKGEYDYESDIDLFVETSINEQLDLKKFEKKLNHNIQLFTKSNVHDFDINLFNNIVNGIKLYGSFKVKNGRGS